MTMTDPIADMLTRLRNANSAFHEEVAMPSSKIKQGIAQIVRDFNREGMTGAKDPGIGAAKWELYQELLADQLRYNRFQGIAQFQKAIRLP